MTFYRSPRNKERTSEKTLAKVDAFVGKETYRILDEISKKRGVPISRLIATAIDNELDTPMPFNYPCPEPDTDFVEGQYFGEAQRIYQFLKDFKTGVDVEMLLLCRRDMGIESRDVLMYALRELTHTSLVEKYKPTRSTFKHFPDDYFRYRVITDDPRDLKKRSRYKQPEEVTTNEQE